MAVIVWHSRALIRRSDDNILERHVPTRCAFSIRVIVLGGSEDTIPRTAHISCVCVISVHTAHACMHSCTNRTIFFDTQAFVVLKKEVASSPC